MSQKRYIDFGNPASAAAAKTIQRQLFAPQVLRADGAFLSAQAPDQIVIQPHAVIFESGVILVEDEVRVVTVPTTNNSTHYTLYYEHFDDDQIGGVPATLRLVAGLSSTVANGVVLGWVVYPGASVALSNAMVYANSKGQVQPGAGLREVVQVGSYDSLVTSGSVYERPTPVNFGWRTIPATLTVALTGAYFSKLLPLAKQHLRVFNVDDSSDMVRVQGAPSPGEYSVTAGDVFAFNAADEGKRVSIFDLTYGNARYAATSGEPGVLDRLFSFQVTDTPFRSIYAEYVALSGAYTVDAVEVLDVNLVQSTLLQTKAQPGVPDGTISRLTVRLLDGAFSGVSGEQCMLRLRETLGQSSEGLLIRVRASTYDLPF
jgi:hypothetical protein